MVLEDGNCILFIFYPPSISYIAFHLLNHPQILAECQYDSYSCCHLYVFIGAIFLHFFP